MKDWKTYAIIILAAWCAYLTWRTMPYQIWEANEAQMKSRKDVYWIGNRHPTVRQDQYRASTNVVRRFDGPVILRTRRKPTESSPSTCVKDTVDCPLPPASKIQ